jgi:hypothetical protein
MNFAKFAQTVAVAGLVMAAVWGQPQAAQAEEIVVESRDSAAINHGVTVLAWARVDGVSPSAEEPSTTCCDDVIVDGDIITGENDDAQASASDSEWKYVPIRRMASAGTDAAGDDDHDILYDPEDDLLPPAKPAGDEEPTPAFDGRLLTARDLTRD